MMHVDTAAMDAFRDHLVEHECSSATVSKYMHDVRQLALFCGGQAEDKAALIAFKEYLQERSYAPASVNSMLTAVNRFWNLPAARSESCGAEAPAEHIHRRRPGAHPAGLFINV